MTLAQMNRYIAAKNALDQHRHNVEQLNLAGLALEREYNDAFRVFEKLPPGVYTMTDGNAIVVRPNGVVFHMPVMVTTGR